MDRLCSTSAFKLLYYINHINFRRHVRDFTANEENTPVVMKNLTIYEKFRLTAFLPVNQSVSQMWAFGIKPCSQCWESCDQS